MKTAYVKFADGDHVVTSINPMVPDEEILSYYAVGHVFNLGDGPADNLQTVVSCVIVQPAKIIRQINL